MPSPLSRGTRIKDFFEGGRVRSGGAGSEGVVVNLYNQRPPAALTKASATSGSGSGASSLDAMLEKKVVSIFLKDAKTNGPVWQAITSAMGSVV